MPFEQLRDRLPVLPAEAASEDTWPRVGRGGVSFSDDLMRAGGGRLAVRIRVTDRPDGGYVIDLRDSDPPEHDDRFRLNEEQARTACLLALGHALGRAPTTAWASRLELLIDPTTWVGAPQERTETTDPAALAFGMARLADALLGALANAWPGRVGAGSCTLGAVVELRPGEQPDEQLDEQILLTEVLPGGEGGRPDRPGADAWPGLIVPAHWDEAPGIEGVVLTGELREGSGGTGKHAGGRGVIRIYRAERPLLACVAFDRVDNPPHGIDRAGPPAGTEGWLHLPDQARPRAVDPWQPVELPAGARLELHTCGGAGWGFPGYGEIEWDPGDWFGSKPKTSG